jgi:putative Mg2+ transporter-C (MgtC) family protein
MKSEFAIFLHVLMASGLSGLIGIEREKGHKPAGVRTNMLVGGAVALLVAMGETIVVHFHDLGLTDFISTDPTRVIQAIIVGISFIGAGMVLQIKEERRIKYLTTAATILISSGIGISVALGKYFLAVAVTLFILFINYLLGVITDRIMGKKDKDI